MASTFGTLNTAYSGLAAARAAIDVTGQNIANVGTDGYTRQRVEQAAVPGTVTPALFSKGGLVGAGVTVTGIARLNDTLVDARVRDTASASGYWNTASAALSSVETSLNEPGPNGLSSALNDFWADWQNVANSAGSTTATIQVDVLITQGQRVAGQLKAGYQAVSDAWSGQLAATGSAVTTINNAAHQVATLNETILRTTVSGGNANEMMDQRDAALKTLAQLTGSTTRQNADGTIDVLVGGSALVAETTARSLTLVGATDLSGAGAHPVAVQWTDSGSPATLDGGSVAAQLATLAGANAGTGGIYAETAQVYNDVATKLATTVNSALQGDPQTGAPGGFTPSGAPGGPFFIVGTPAATGLTVAVKSIADIGLNSAPTSQDGSVADALSQQGAATTSSSAATAANSPDLTWSAFVANIGVQSQNAATQSTVAASAAAAATTAQTSQSGVDLDEETANLITFQHAYQAAARVITTLDSMLDTLINHTGLTA